MKAWLLAIMLVCGTALPSLVAAQSSGEATRKNHVELGIFADYYRFEAPSSANTINFLGLGGRAAFYMNEHAAIEAEMAYDFERNNSTVNNINGNLTRTRTRPLHGLFGPKFDLGGHGADFFLTGKVGFVNLAQTTATPLNGFGNSFSSIDSGATKFAVYPGGGIEGFWGPFGLRLDVGDEIYFLNGAQNNLRVTFGPHFKF
jgi:hypothetical protein